MTKSFLTADEINRQLEEPTDDRRPLKHQIKREAKIKDLIQALMISKSSLSRRILCDILGDRHAKSAIPILIKCLDDDDWKVRSDAAEALSKIGSSKAGESLLEHLKKDPLPAYVFALGSVGYRDAIPFLESMLESDSNTIRGGAAWSLGVLRALEAKGVLLKALLNENDGWVLNHINNAINQLDK
ncbi:MAG: HEAT repeat domain-containing protein [Anaerolineaceae bacterium]|nr:HEAT repeat domain-containing protein [Anaerolineaceae bacterium]